MTDVTLFGKQGFNDWKNANNLIQCHETSVSHRQAVVSLLLGSDSGKRVDSQLLKQMEDKRVYWKAVLERVAETVRFLAERGLAFRGSDEIVGSSHNGNYLGVLELLSKFDPFLAHFLPIQNNNVMSLSPAFLIKLLRN
jgi:hypothetical protein